MKIQMSIEIASPPEKIWPFLVQPEKILKWCIFLHKFEYTGEQHSGVGTPFYSEEKAGGRLMKLNFVVTEWVENKSVVCRMTSCEMTPRNFLKSYEEKLTIEATPSGSRFSYMEEFKLPYGVIGKILGLFARSSAEAHVKEMLTKLKSLAEA
jgi:uncharacterized protein YndB with AHSA1/START domain